MDIGQNACLLLCYIAHTEDAARYSGPVRFWNEQLMTVMGFKSPKQLNEARSKAESAGWLVYERSGNREVGRYWVTVPEHFEGLSDAVIEDNRSVIHSENGTNSGMNKERITERIGDGSRNENGTESGKPSNPIPVPRPVPEKHRDALASDVPQVSTVNASDAALVNAPLRRSVVRQERFERPTVSDVIGYVREINATVDAKEFVDYYESNGWRVGRNPMKDWRATVRRWNNKKLDGQHYGNGSKSKASSREQDTADAFNVFLAAADATNAAVSCEGST
jgi:hypothetical protein